MRAGVDEEALTSDSGTIRTGQGAPFGGSPCSASGHLQRYAALLGCVAECLAGLPAALPAQRRLLALEEFRKRVLELTLSTSQMMLRHMTEYVECPMMPSLFFRWLVRRRLEWAMVLSVLPKSQLIVIIPSISR